MRDMLLAANAAVRKAGQAGQRAFDPAPSRPSSKGTGRPCARGWPSIARCPPSIKRNRAARLKQRPGYNLLIRFKAFKDDMLRFLVDFDVPFTNNLAEQDIRMTKVKMKISGAFRTFAGAKAFARLRSIVSTARKQGYNILQILAASPSQTPSRNGPLKPKAWELPGETFTAADVLYAGAFALFMKRPC